MQIRIKNNRLRLFFTLYDGWRENTEPSYKPDLIPIGQCRSFIHEYVVPGNYGEPGRFFYPKSRPDTFPVLPLPILSFSRHNNDPSVKLIPSDDFIDTQGYSSLKNEIDFNAVPYSQKTKHCFFWRGGTNGVSYKRYAGDIGLNQRQLLVARNGGYINASFGHSVLKKDYIKHAFLIDIDGFVNAFSGLYWKLYSGSTVFKVMSHNEQWYYDKLKPFIHYVPIKGDLSDIEEKFNWAINNISDCEWIGNNRRELAKSITYQSVLNEYKL